MNVNEMDNLDQGGNEAPEKVNPPKSEDAGDATIERYKQQIEGSKKEALTQKERADHYAERTITYEVEKATNDAQALLDLHESDPQLANDVAKRFGYSSFKEAKKAIKDAKKGWSDKDEDKTKKGLSEDEFDKKYKEKRKQEVHNESLDLAKEFIWEQSKDESVIKAISERFEDITEWKTLTTKKAIEYAEMATLYVTKKEAKSVDKNEALKRLSSTGLSSKWKSKTSDGLDYDWKDMIISPDGKMILDPKKGK